VQGAILNDVVAQYKRSDGAWRRYMFPIMSSATVQLLGSGTFRTRPAQIMLLFVSYFLEIVIQLSMIPS
jgi:hypothetical protein